MAVHFARLLIFILITGGCVCGFLAATTCEFFYYESKLPEELPFPFANTSEAYVGIFGFYTDYGNSTLTSSSSSECVPYDKVLFGAIGDTTTFMVSSQFAAIIGPSFGALAWLVNLVEWFCRSNTLTYILAITFLVLAFVIQGSTFLIYAQSEFCFDDEISENCQLKMGAIMAIIASASFYMAAVVWCCTPNSTPMCGRSTSKRQEDLGGDDYYLGQAAAVAEFNNNNHPEPKSLEGEDNYYVPQTATMDTVGSSNSWSDANNNNPIAYGMTNAHNSANWNDETSTMSKQTPGVAYDDPRGWDAIERQHEQQQQEAGWQDHTSGWTTHETTNPTGATHDDPFANPFQQH